MDVPGYLIEEELGSGAAAIVYRARHELLDAMVALKVLRQGLSDHDRRRAEAERRAMARLRGHPHVVTVFDAGTTPGGRDWFALELMSGGSLKERIRAGPPAEPSEVASTGAAIASALAAAHADGLVHRDVKPANVLLTPDGVPKLADFGIVSDLAESAYTSSALTVAYAAPELINGERPAHPCDVYSLCLTLYELASGTHPFVQSPNDPVFAVLARIGTADIPPLDTVPQPLATAIFEGLSREPENRPTAAALERRLVALASRFEVDALTIRGIQLHEVIGHGGFATVHRGVQTALGREVAVKVLHATVEDQQAIRLFQREARTLAALSDVPGVIAVLDAGITAGGHPYLVFPLLTGKSLAERISLSGPMPPEAVAALGERLAEALREAHSRGVLHLDLKPANVLFDAAGASWLIDFGISRVVAVTSSATIRATPLYAAPEILDGQEPSAAADVYGLGGVLYTAMAGRPAIEAAGGDIDVIEHVRAGAVLEPPNGPRWLADLIMSCLARRPDQRPMLTDVAFRLGHGAHVAARLTKEYALGGEAVPAEESSHRTPQDEDDVEHEFAPSDEELSSSADNSTIPLQAAAESAGSGRAATLPGPGSRSPWRPARRLALSLAGLLVLGLVAVVIIARLGRDVGTGAEAAQGLPAGGFGGAEVTIIGPEADDRQIAGIQGALEAFAEANDINVAYQGEADAEATLASRVAGGDPPSIFIFSQPGMLRAFADEGALVPLTDEVNATVDESWGEDFQRYGRGSDGSQFGVPVKTDLKSLVWYQPARFEENGYEVPTTFDEFITLLGRMVADGNTPLCVGIESGQATGWPYTDWVEEMVLRLHGPDVYDQWVNHDIPFNDPQIVEAMQVVLDVWAPENVFASGGSIAATNFRDNAQPLVDGRCMMHRQGNFFAGLFPEGTAFADGSEGAVDVFYFPDINGDAPVLTAGTLAAAFNDDPATMAVLNYMATPEYAERRQQIQTEMLGGSLSGFLSAAQGQDPSMYLPLEQRFLEILDSAEIARFDGSDLMPAEVGTGTFWSEGASAVNGDISAHDAADAIEASWPS